MANISSGHVTIEKAYETKNTESVVKSFALLKAIHGLPYRIFDSIYFKNALDSFRSSKNRIEISSYAISKELQNTHILSQKKLTSTIADLDTVLLLAIDGWTNCRKNKVTNVLILNPKMKHTYYWTSF